MIPKNRCFPFNNTTRENVWAFVSRFSIRLMRFILDSVPFFFLFFFSGVFDFVFFFVFFFNLYLFVFCNNVFSIRAHLTIPSMMRVCIYNFPNNYIVYVYDNFIPNQETVFMFFHCELILLWFVYLFTTPSRKFGHMYYGPFFDF